MNGCEVYLAVDDLRTFSNSMSIICLFAFPICTTPERLGKVLMESRTCFSFISLAGGGQETSCNQKLTEEGEKEADLDIVRYEPGGVSALHPVAGGLQLAACCPTPHSYKCKG